MAGIGTVITQRAGVSRFYGWRLIGALWLILSITFSFPMYGSSVIYSRMAGDLGLSASSLGLAFTLMSLMAGVPGPAVAWAINRFGARWTMLAGNLLMAGGAVALATLPLGGSAAAIVFGVTIGLGVMGGGLLGAQTLAARWFERGRARAMAIMFTSAGVGGFFAPAAFNAIIERFTDWRAGWWLLAGLAAFSGIVAFLTVREYPGDLGQAPDGKVTVAGAKASQAAGLGWTFASAIRSRQFWIVIFAGTAFNGSLTFLLAHSIIHLQHFGAKPQQAAFALSLIAIASLAGKLLLSWIGDRVPLKTSWALAMALLVVGLILAIHPFAIGGIYVFPLVCGLGIGMSLVCVSALPAELFGPKVFASILGVSLMLQTLASALSPLLAGLTFDSTGSYRPFILVMTALCATACVLLATLRVQGPGDGVKG